MRLFVASRLGPGVRRDLRPRVRELVRASGDCLRPVPEGSEHFTHHFLGHVEVDPERILTALDVVAGRSAFDVRVGEASILGRRSKPRLVLLRTLAGTAELMALGEEVRERIGSILELPPEGRRRKPPHVTVARFRRGSAAPAARAVARALDDGALGGWSGEDRVVAIELVASELTVHGPKYRTLGAVELAARPG